jgi:outer membrane protein assembly factor BamB
MSATDDRFERELDTWWNEEVSNLPHPPRPSLPAADLALIRDLHASHSPAAPSPAFAQSLRESLMNQAIRTSPAQPAAPPPAASPVRLIQPVFSRRSHPSSRRWSALANLAAALLVIFALAASAISGAPRTLWSSFFQQSATPIPAANTNTVVTYRGDSGRTGAMLGPDITGMPKVAWQQFLYNVASTPVYANDRLFVNQGGQGEVAPTVVALDLKTGEMLWRTQVGSDAEAIPAVDERFVYVLTDQQTLVALKQESGEVVWTYPTGGTMGPVSPAVANGLVFLETNDRSVRAVDAATGAERWRAIIPATNVAPTPDEATLHSTVPVAVGDGLVLAAADNGELLAFDLESGKRRWTKQTAGNVITAVAASDGAFYVIAQKVEPSNPPITATLYALNADGSEQWRVDQVDPGRDLAVGNGAVYVAGTLHAPNLPADSLAAFDARDGHRLWTAAISNASAPSFVGDTVYVAAGGSGQSGYSHIYAIDASSGAVRWRAFVGPVGTPLVVDGLIVMPTINGIQVFGGDGTSATPVPGVTYVIPDIVQCSPPRITVPAVVPSGTPSAVLITGRTQVVNGLPEILLNELPTGPHANRAVLDGVQQTLVKMANCVAWGDQKSLAGFVTDDYLRRPEVRTRSEAAGFPSAWPIYGPDSAPVTRVMDGTQLPDGRVGVAIMTSASTGWYVIFAQQDGQWLIDEEYEIVAQLGGHG